MPLDFFAGRETFPYLFGAISFPPRSEQLLKSPCLVIFELVLHYLTDRSNS